MNHFLIISTIILLLIFASILINSINIKKKINYIILSFPISIIIIYSSFNLPSLNFININWWKLYLAWLVIVSFCIIINLDSEEKWETNFLVFLVLIGSLIVILHDHLIFIYVGLELQTFSILILLAKNKTSIKSIEASIKYFILGGLSSGIFLLGTYFLFYTNASLNIYENKIFSDSLLVILAYTLIIISFLFKFGVFPFHFWILDVYEGSSWKNLSIVSILPKIASLSIIIDLVINSNMILICSLFL